MTASVRPCSNCGGPLTGGGNHGRHCPCGLGLECNRDRVCADCWRTLARNAAERRLEHRTRSAA